MDPSSQTVLCVQRCWWTHQLHPQWLLTHPWHLRTRTRQLLSRPNKSNRECKLWEKGIWGKERSLHGRTVQISSGKPPQNSHKRRKLLRQWRCRGSAPPAEWWCGLKMEIRQASNMIPQQTATAAGIFVFPVLGTYTLIFFVSSVYALDINRKDYRYCNPWPTTGCLATIYNWLGATYDLDCNQTLGTQQHGQIYVCLQHPVVIWQCFYNHFTENWHFWLLATLHL